MAAPTSLPDHVERYVSSLPRVYTEEQHGASVQLMAEAITREQRARYSALLARSVLAGFVAGILLGFGLAGVL